MATSANPPPVVGSVTAAPAVRELLTGLVDYAGLFPPAELDMPAAVEEYARHQVSGEAWMLGRFVVPLARLDELDAAVGADHRKTAECWPLSVLVGGDYSAAAERLGHLPAPFLAEAVELKPSHTDDIAAARRAFTGLETFFELPYDGDLGPWMAAIGEFGGAAKIRSGAITADGFPSALEMARFLRATARAGVPFKATAGLHHALRGDYRLTYADDSPSGVMHGFLNVFLAAAWVLADDLSEAEVGALLEERSASAFSFADDAIAWRDRRLDRAAIRAGRQRFALSYGSCSFTEPIEDLASLGLL